MWTTAAGGRVIVVGEDIHTTRVVLRSGKSAAEDAAGRPCVRFVEPDGSDALLPLPPEILGRGEYAGGRIKHVKAAVLAAMAGKGDGEAGLRFIRALAVRQAGAGADYLDLNVDEVSSEPAERAAAMRWLVGVVESAADLPIALDSSSAEVIAAGVEASRSDRARLLLNSASVERLEVLDMAASLGCSVVASAAGRSAMPAGVEDRVANARVIVAEATGRGIPLSRIHVDALVLPVGADPDAGAHFAGAIRALRAEFGPEIHLTGGFSNVSFGLPARRLLNEAFLALAVEAGADSAIVDPLAVDPEKTFRADRESRPWQLATAFLTGVDAYGGKYLRAYRAGELAGAGA